MNRNAALMARRSTHQGARSRRWYQSPAIARFAPRTSTVNVDPGEGARVLRRKSAMADDRHKGFPANPPLDGSLAHDPALGGNPRSQGRELGERRPIALTERAEDLLGDRRDGGGRVLRERLAAARENRVSRARIMAVRFAGDDPTTLERAEKTRDARRRHGEAPREIDAPQTPTGRVGQVVERCEVRHPEAVGA